LGPEVVGGFLWLARTSLRCGRMPVRAGHGYADAAYRPPELPFVSVLGPMAIDVEPDRDDKPRHVLVQMPGYLLSARRESLSSIAAGGALKVRFDGDATTTLTALPGVSLADDVDCEAFAAAVEQALVAAAQGGLYTDPDSKVVVADARLAELAGAKVRWDREIRCFAISSGRQGLLGRSVAAPSSVEVLPVAGSLSGALGLDDGTRVPGRVHRHKLHPPKAMTLDVRIDLWASTQPEIASLSDSLCRLAPSRGVARTLSALLAVDAAEGSDTLVLLSQGEPTLPISIVHVEAEAGARDRVTGRVLSPTPAAPVGGFLTLDAATPAMGLRVLPAPLVPGPFDVADPLPRGVALTLGLRVQSGGTAGQALSLCALTFGGTPVLALTAALVQTNGSVSADLTAVATFDQGNGATGTASTTMRLPLSTLEAGLELHAAVVAATGTIELFVAGQPQALDDPKVTPVPPVAVPGTLVAGRGMQFVIGTAGGNPLDLSISHVHLQSEPVGPFDPELRMSVARASRFSPGRRIEITRRGEKISPESRVSLNILSVSGNTLKVSPPLPATFAAGTAQVFANELFFQQVALRRKDDLANHLYRLTGDYRVSATLEQDIVEPPVPAVETPMVEITSLGSGADGASSGPGTFPSVV